MYERIYERLSRCPRRMHGSGAASGSASPWPVPSAQVTGDSVDRGHPWWKGPSRRSSTPDPAPVSRGRGTCPPRPCWNTVRPARGKGRRPFDARRTSGFPGPSPARSVTSSSALLWLLYGPGLDPVVGLFFGARACTAGRVTVRGFAASAAIAGAGGRALGADAVGDGRRRGSGGRRADRGCSTTGKAWLRQGAVDAGWLLHRCRSASSAGHRPAACPPAARFAGGCLRRLTLVLVRLAAGAAAGPVPFIGVTVAWGAATGCCRRRSTPTTSTTTTKTLTERRPRKPSASPFESYPLRLREHAVDTTSRERMLPKFRYTMSLGPAINELRPHVLLAH